MRLILFFILVISPAFPLLAAETYYVRSAKAVASQEFERSSETVATLKRGEPVEKILTQKNRYKVLFTGKEGWVDRFFLSKKPPRKRISLFQTKVDISSKARKRASVFSTAATARGLVNTRSEQTPITDLNFDAVESMENMVVLPEIAHQFMSDND